MCYDGILMCPCCLYVRFCVRRSGQTNKVNPQPVNMWQARERGNIFPSEILKLSQTLVQLPHASQPPISICFNYQHITVMAFCCHLLPLFPQLTFTIFCSLSSNLEKLRVLLHDVEKDAVYVFSQVDVDILLVL